MTDLLEMSMRPLSRKELAVLYILLGVSGILAVIVHRLMP